MYVKGNGQTKRSIVGIRGKVKGMPAPGGWHTVELKGGDIGLQRNALQPVQGNEGNESPETTTLVSPGALRATAAREGAKRLLKAR